MKKFLVITVVAIALVALWFVARDTSQVVKQDTNSNITTRNELRPDPANATFIFNEGPVSLSQGRNDKPVAPGSPFMEATELLESRAYGDINNDGKTDTAVLLARYGVGSGTFIYMGGYISGPINYRGTNVGFIGDRISPQGISVSNNVVTVNFLGRDENEPFTAEPTIQMYKQFRYSNGNFTEI